MNMIMKRVKLFLLAVFLMLPLLSISEVQAAGIRKLQPGTSKAKAVELETDGTFRDDSSKVYFEDKTGGNEWWYKFEVTADDVKNNYYFDICVTNTSMSSNLKHYLLDNTEQEVATFERFKQAGTWDNVQKGETSNINEKLPAKTYYLKLVSQSSGNATVSVTKRKDNEADSYESATKLAYAQEYLGYVEHLEDVDYFTFKTNSSTEYTLDFVKSAPVSQFNIDVYDNTMNLESDNFVQGVDKEASKTISLSLKKNTTYYIEISTYAHQRRDLTANDFYTLKISHVPTWKKTNGKWWYELEDGSYPKDKWQKISGKWYYFDRNGYMLTGWQKISGQWYYMNSSGVMQKGWVKIGGKYYYMNSSGVMQKNKWIGNYYVQSDGSMAVNKWIGNYHVNSSGKWDKTR